MEEAEPAPQAREQPPYLRSIEFILGFVGGFTCAVVPLIFTAEAVSLSPPRSGLSNFWPAPGIYFLEILFIGLATSNFIAANHAPKPNRWSGLPWIGAGILLAFAILAILTIGIFLAPAMLAFLVVAILGDRRQGGNWPTHAMLFFFAAMAQAVAFFLLQLLFRW
jgi:hypothetical protein